MILTETELELLPLIVRRFRDEVRHERRTCGGDDPELARLETVAGAILDKLDRGGAMPGADPIIQDLAALAGKGFDAYAALPGLAHRARALIRQHEGGARIIPISQADPNAMRETHPEGGS